MRDILSFNHFVTQDVLIVFYYIGAVVMPLFMWFARGWIVRNVDLAKRWNQTFGKFYTSFSIGGKAGIILGVIGLFLCMELCWRMIFEVMIGYFDMHDYLYEIYRQGAG